MRRMVQAAAMVMLVGASACKKKVPPPPPEEVVPVQKVEAKLQITSLTPGSVDVGQSVAAKVYGAGFQQDSKVEIGGVGIAGVRQIDPNTLSLSIPANLPVGSHDVVVRNGDGGSATLRSGLSVRGGSTEVDCRFTRVLFGFDSAGLEAGSRTALDANVGCYQSQSSAIRISGHTDERGTTDYNLALGQRRANSVRDHLSRQGVTKGKISTVSYGEERPAGSGSGESKWANDRRAEVTAE